MPAAVRAFFFQEFAVRRSFLNQNSRCLFLMFNQIFAGKTALILSSARLTNRATSSSHRYRPFLCKVLIGSAVKTSAEIIMLTSTAESRISYNLL